MHDVLPLEPPVVHAQGVVAGGAGVGHLVADIQTARNAGKTAETARGAQEPNQSSRSPVLGTWL